MKFDELCSKLILENELKPNNILDDIYFAIKKGMDYYGFFKKSIILDTMIDSYEDSVEYRKNKSKIQNEIKGFLEESFLSKIENLPYDLSGIGCYISIEPESKENFKIGGFTDPFSNKIQVNIHINNVIKNAEDFKSEFYYVLVHEFIHARQIYTAKIEKKELSIPKLSMGSIKSKESIKDRLENYLMHPSELEAYALEYNYRRKNDPSFLEDFAKDIVRDFDFIEKDEELMEFYVKYVRELEKYIKMYPWEDNLFSKHK
jgi:hypothetical protein